jgi:hypothetical protein
VREIYDPSIAKHLTLPLNAIADNILFQFFFNSFEPLLFLKNYLWYSIKPNREELKSPHMREIFPIILLPRLFYILIFLSSLSSLLSKWVFILRSSFSSPDCFIYRRFSSTTSIEVGLYSCCTAFSSDGFDSFA